MAGSTSDLITELVHQFSDPFAFYRELIQNSIDAGSARIEVVLSFSPAVDDGLLSAAVSDWGEGMDRSIIERYLLTKFHSSKEGDLTKIGKFGIGFMSVFAPAPDLVVVDTGRDGEDWRLLFHPDLSYELLRGPEPVEGTVVTLHKQMTAPQYAEFVASSRRAVSRWCRHSDSDVTFTAGPSDGSPPPPPESVREPFTVDAPFTVEYRDPQTRVVVGPARRHPPFAGFYNRGLTLYENDEEHVPGFSFKAVSDLLEHTLTRDDVKRDRGFERVIAIVERLARTAIPTRLAQELELRAERDEPGEDYGLLLDAAFPRLAAKKIVVPGFAPGPTTLADLEKAALRSSAVLWAATNDALVQAVLARGLPVLRWPDDRLPGVLIRKPWRGVAVSEAYRLAREPPLLPAEKALCAALAPLLERLGARATRVSLGDITGAGAKRLHACVDAIDSAQEAATERDPFRTAGLLLFNRGHPACRSAIALAELRPGIAALLLVRRLAVLHGRLDDRADLAITEQALAS